MFKALNIQNLEQAGGVPEISCGPHDPILRRFTISGVIGAGDPAHGDDPGRCRAGLPKVFIGADRRWKKRIPRRSFVVVFIVFPTLLIRIETDCQSSNPKSV